jgi:truncated hemoglobin YjbI
VSTQVEDFLAHYGVKGMKWGVRRKSGPASADSARSTAVKTNVKTGGVKSVSNKDLQDAITRMRLEQDFKRLKTNERPVVTRFIASTLQEIGKREVQAQVAKKLARTAAKAAV